MQVKLNITGELEKHIEERSINEVRNFRQQVMYMLQECYKRDMAEKSLQQNTVQPIIMYANAPQGLTPEQIKLQCGQVIDNSVVNNTFNNDTTDMYEEVEGKVENAPAVETIEPSYEEDYEDLEDEESILY